jgi:hypothetical protein
MLSPMGEPLAMLPPSVAVLRMGGAAEAAQHLGEVGQVFRHGGHHAVQRHGGADAPVGPVSSMRLSSAMPPT